LKLANRLAKPAANLQRATRYNFSQDIEEEKFQLQVSSAPNPVSITSIIEDESGEIAGDVHHSHNCARFFGQSPRPSARSGNPVVMPLPPEPKPVAPSGEGGARAAPLDAATIAAALARMRLRRPGERFVYRPLDGGVSSEIWLVVLPGRRLCLKRALPRLRVAQLWEAPVARNHYEAAWLRVAGTICPEAVPYLLGEDAANGMFAMDYLDPGAYPVWKYLLRDGHADPAIAAQVGERLALIHAATAGDIALARDFATDESFHALRLEPYLLAAGRAHPDLAAPLGHLVATTAATRLALVHGDVSPKNILIGPRGPVFLDAECAWYGDPAFDLAFCLNHLLLKCLWNREAVAGFLAGFERLAASYLGRVAWEPPAVLEARAARLLPGLLLARIDGKSPVEYVTREADKERVRRVARTLLRQPVATLSAVRAHWADSGTEAA
jgi:aminoglycoside phosphotransferase (APT) family kinase protein